MPTDFDSEIAAGRPRNCDLGAREDNLLNTAAALFLERGYSGTSLGLIAREAHVAVRTIYVKFGGKSGLLSALICRGRAHYAAHLTDLLSDTGPLITAWYNQQHRHSGIAMMTPESVHTGRAAEVRKQRQATLQSAFERTPNRFKNRLPQPHKLPTAAWINPPVMEKKAA